MTENKATSEDLQQRMDANPFINWMGMKIEELTGDQISVTIRWREEMVSNPKVRYTHGGVIAAVIDTVADYAVAAKVGIPVPTVDMRVDFHRAAAPGDLRAVGRVVRLGNTNTVAEGFVYDGDDRLIASGRGLYFTAAARN